MLTQLRSEWEREGKGVPFEVLSDFLSMSRTEIPYERVAAALNVPAGTARVVVHRLRKRYRALLRREVAATLLPAESLEEEMRALMDALIH